MDSNRYMFKYPYHHPIWEDYQQSRWPYEHPYGIHNYDPTLWHRPDHPVHYYLQRQHWVPTSDSDPFDRYIIHGQEIKIPKWVKQGDKWSQIKTSDLLKERQDQARFLSDQRWRRNDLNNRRYPYSPKWPPRYYWQSQPLQPLAYLNFKKT